MEFSNLHKSRKADKNVTCRAPLPTLNFIYYDRWSIDWLIDCLDWLIDWLIDCLDSLTDRLIDWVIDWLKSSCCGAIYPFSLVLKLLSHLTRTPETKENTVKPIVFSHDVTAAILLSQNIETAAMLVSQTNPVGVELFSYVNAFFCSSKFA